jgi:hypothetical protein
MLYAVGVFNVPSIELNHASTLKLAVKLFQKSIESDLTELIKSGIVFFSPLEKGTQTMDQKIVPLTVRMPSAWKDAIAEEALKRRETLTEFCTTTLLGSLPRKVRDSLPEREFKQQGRPPESSK